MKKLLLLFSTLLIFTACSSGVGLSFKGTEQFDKNLIVDEMNAFVLNQPLVYKIDIDSETVELLVDPNTDVLVVSVTSKDVVYNLGITPTAIFTILESGTIIQLDGLNSNGKIDLSKLFDWVNGYNYDFLRSERISTVYKDDQYYFSNIIPVYFQIYQEVMNIIDNYVDADLSKYVLKDTELSIVFDREMIKYEATVTGTSLDLNVKHINDEQAALLRSVTDTHVVTG